MHPLLSPATTTRRGKSSLRAPRKCSLPPIRRPVSEMEMESGKLPFGGFLKKAEEKSGVDLNADIEDGK